MITIVMRDNSGTRSKKALFCFGNNILQHSWLSNLDLLNLFLSFYYHKGCRNRYNNFNATSLGLDMVRKPEQMDDWRLSVVDHVLWLKVTLLWLKVNHQWVSVMSVFCQSMRSSQYYWNSTQEQLSSVYSATRCDLTFKMMSNPNMWKCVRSSVIIASRRFTGWAKNPFRFRIGSMACFSLAWGYRKRWMALARCIYPSLQEG